MPFKNQVHVDQLLSQVSIKYRNDNYIAQEVFPRIPVKKSSDLYRVYDRNFRLPETSRAHNGEAREHNFTVSNETYVLERHALKEHVSDEQAANYDISDLRADTVEELTDKIMLRKEKSVADVVTTKANWSQNVSLAAAGQWSLNTTTSNPITLMDTASTSVLESCGKVPNYAVVPRAVMLAAKNHDSVIDRVKYTSAEITPNMLAALFDLDQMLVPTSIIDSAAEGATESIGAVYSDNIFVGYKPDRAGPMKASAGYMFEMTMPLVKRWRVEERDSEAIEVNVNYTPRIVSSLSGYLIIDALA